MDAGEDLTRLAKLASADGVGIATGAMLAAVTTQIRIRSLWFIQRHWVEFEQVWIELSRQGCELPTIELIHSVPLIQRSTTSPRADCQSG
jgi:hypothetical protein